MYAKDFILGIEDMTAKADLLLVATGSVLTHGAVLQSLDARGTPSLALLWAVVALVGMVVVLVGTRRALDRDAAGPRPENALGKTDPRFGSR
jgi:hypothetical protein